MPSTREGMKKTNSSGMKKMVIRKVNRRKASGGFTLVELLVVITIITILAGLITVAAFNAVRAARDFSIAQEVVTLQAAVTAYKNEYGDFFPSSTEGAAGQAALKRHMRTAFRNHRESDAVLNEIQLDASEALVFFLGGNFKYHEHNDPQGNDTTRPKFVFMIDNQEYPFSGARDSSGFNGKGRAISLFDFDETRLIDYDGDGFYSYAPKYTDDAPLVYFNHKQYSSASMDFTTGPSNHGAVKPYKTTSPKGVTYLQPKGFQIIAAGQDGNFGVFANASDEKLFPSGQKFSVEDNDNISNFSDKGRFENSAL